MNMLMELNRIMKWGGLVILTTPNITSAFSVQEALAGAANITAISGLSKTLAWKSKRARRWASSAATGRARPLCCRS